MATNQYQQSVLNKSRNDKFKLVFQLPHALKRINTNDDRKNGTVIEDSIVATGTTMIITATTAAIDKITVFPREIL